VKKHVLALLIMLCSASTAACPAVTVGLVQVAKDLWLRPAPVQASDGWTEPTLVWVNAHTLWVLDPGPHRCAGQALRRELQQRWPGRLQQLINTHAHPENVLANSAWPAGTPIYALPGVRAQMAKRCALCLRNLRDSLGKKIMKGTRWVLPNRSLHPGQILPLGAGRWQVLAHHSAHTETDLSLLEMNSHQWFAGSLVAWQGLPDLSRASLEGWRSAMARADTQPAGVTWVGDADAAASQLKWEGTRSYLQALHAQVSQALARGQSMHEAMQAWQAVPPNLRSPAMLRRHDINVQRAWRQLEEAAFDAPAQSPVR
jgi:glyoxylase-like metal-dependent hydrolase (beta-lactamase superfamily II)